MDAGRRTTATTVSSRVRSVEQFRQPRPLTVRTIPRSSAAVSRRPYSGSKDYFSIEVPCACPMAPRDQRLADAVLAESKP